MADIATCAKCGDTKELCESVRDKGIKQPRICKDCLLVSMRTDDWSINNSYWVYQMQELNDIESLVNLNLPKKEK